MRDNRLIQDTHEKSTEPEAPLDSTEEVVAVMRLHPRARIIVEARVAVGRKKRRRKVHELVVPGSFASGGFALHLVETTVVNAMETAGLLVARAGRYFLASAAGTAPGGARG
jgi:hypothetical protein